MHPTMILEQKSPEDLRLLFKELLKRTHDRAEQIQRKIAAATRLLDRPPLKRAESAAPDHHDAMTDFSVPSV